MHQQWFLKWKLKRHTYACLAINFTLWILWAEKILTIGGSITSLQFEQIECDQTRKFVVLIVCTETTESKLVKQETRYLFHKTFSFIIYGHFGVNYRIFAIYEQIYNQNLAITTNL